MTNILLNNLIDNQKEITSQKGSVLGFEKNHSHNFEKILEKKNENYEKHIHKFEEKIEKFNDKIAKFENRSLNRTFNEEKNNSDTQNSIEDPNTEITTENIYEAISTEDVVNPDVELRDNKENDIDSSVDVEENEFGICDVFDAIKDFVVKFVPQESSEINNVLDSVEEQIETALDNIENIDSKDLPLATLLGQIQNSAEEQDATLENDVLSDIDNAEEAENVSIDSEVAMNSDYTEENSVMNNITNQTETPTTEKNNLTSQTKSEVNIFDENEVLKENQKLETTNLAKESIANDSQAMEFVEDIANAKDNGQIEESQKVIEKDLAKTLEENMIEELNIESFDSEASADDGSSDLMKHQSPQEQGIKAMIQGDAEVQEFRTEIKPTSNIQDNKPVHEANPSKILDQISKQLDKLQNNSKVNIVLNPESLGKVTIQLIQTKEGLSAQFTCATQEARNLLMKGLEGLKETLISQGVNVDNVSVKHSETYNNPHHQDWTEQEGSRGGNKEGHHHRRHRREEKAHFEQAMFNIEHNNENGKV